MELLTSQDIASFKQNPADKMNSEEQRKRNICGKIFKTQHGLKIHTSKVHSDVKEGQLDHGNTFVETGRRSDTLDSLKCSMCNFFFQDVSSLKEHAFKCKRLFKCDTCEKSFADIANVKNHTCEKHEAMDINNSDFVIL